MTHIATIHTTDPADLGRTVLAIAEAIPAPLTLERTVHGLAVYRQPDPAQLSLIDIDERLAGHVPEVA